MNTLDIIVVAVVALSGLFAFVRGLVRETLSIAAWIGAGAVTFYFFAPLYPVVEGWIPTKIIAQIATSLLLFVPTLVFFTLLVGVASSQVRAIGLGSLDRVLGLLFGVARGTLVCCAAWIIVDQMLPADTYPDWIKNSVSQKWLKLGADQIVAYLPKDLIKQGKSAAGDAKNRIDAGLKASDAVTNASKALDQANDAIGALTSTINAAPEPEKANGRIVEVPAKPASEAKPAPDAKPVSQKPTPQKPANGYKPDQQQEMNRLFQQKDSGKQ